MREKSIKILLLMCFCLNLLAGQEQKFSIHTVAFYNVENLFDTIRDPGIYDEQWTPEGKQRWGSKKYWQKINNLAKVIAQIGTDENNNMPTILGIAEVENRNVIEDLIKDPLLITADYGIIHYDSPDKRGIDVTLLYQKKYFIPTHTSNIPLYIYEVDKRSKKEKAKKRRIYTRDQLLVTGFLEGEEIHFLINHWPSRSGGEHESSPLREAAAVLNRKIIDSLYLLNPDAKMITMGDFNDEPFDKSIKEVLGTKGKKEQVEKGGLFNPMEQIAKEGMGTMAYRDTWYLFDQIIVSESLIRGGSDSFRLWKAQVFIKPFMVHNKGVFEGYPLRNHYDEIGFSDHFPVYIYLIRKASSRG